MNVHEVQATSKLFMAPIRASRVHCDTFSGPQAKRYITTMEGALGCRLETASQLVNLLSLGAQPDEEEVEADATDPEDVRHHQQHPIHGTVLRLLHEAQSFLQDLSEESEESSAVSTSAGRLINVPAYCLRAVVQCETITNDMGVFCGCLVARVFLRHLYRLEGSRAAALATLAPSSIEEGEDATVVEHADDRLTRLLRYTATQLALVARLFQTAYDA